MSKMIDQLIDTPAFAQEPAANEPQDLELHHFHLNDSSKQDRGAFAADIVQRINDGHVNPLAIHLQMKNMEDITARLTDAKKYPETAIPFRDALQDAADKYGSKGFEFHNGKFQVKEAGTRYDFGTCQDPVWDRLSAELEELKAKVKEREELLKKAPAGGMQILCEGGELATVYPPLKVSTTTIAVTLK